MTYPAEMLLAVGDQPLEDFEDLCEECHPLGFNTSKNFTHCQSCWQRID